MLKTRDHMLLQGKECDLVTKHLYFTKVGTEVFSVVNFIPVNVNEEVLKYFVSRPTRTLWKHT